MMLFITILRGVENGDEKKEKKERERKKKSKRGEVMDQDGGSRAVRWALHLAIGLTLCAHMSSASQVGLYVRSCDARLMSVQQVCVCCCMRRGKTDSRGRSARLGCGQSHLVGAPRL